MDFFRECNNLNVPEEDFKLSWCNRCLQKDCVRSGEARSRFEARTATWEERLFLKVPRMPETDPRFPIIASKEFQSVENKKPYEVKGWDEPAPVETPTPKQVASVPAKFTDVTVPGSVDKTPIKMPDQTGRVLETVGEMKIQPGGKIRLRGS